ncbi:MAG: 30S ribosomal protein S5, partial [Chloroflexota bacterium]
RLANRVRNWVTRDGIRDILSKSLGSSNPVNVVMATMRALQQLRSPEQVSELRGVTVGRRPAETAVGTR